MATELMRMTAVYLAGILAGAIGALYVTEGGD